MPYITSDRRSAVYPEARHSAQTPGEVNYQVTEVMLDYINTKGSSYQTINDLVGALECAKLELYRRLAAPYEDEKIKENGDVY